MHEAARRRTHEAVSTALARRSDRALHQLVDGAEPIGSGIGGTSVLLEVAGHPVFVKRVPLTDLERRRGNVRSTADLFGLPLCCHYGIGGPGFGAWRELAVHEMTTDWVLAGQYAGFPLLYHWRVLPDRTTLPEELADIDRTVAYWGGGVRHRIEALQQASASVALFLEYIPQNLHRWLGEQMTESACAMVESELEAGVAFMKARGLLHFDAHFENILTDGRRLYFADFGLALSEGFELSRDEGDFFRRHQTYDRAYALSYLVNWLMTALYGLGRDDREAAIHAYAHGERPTGIPAYAADIIARHAPLAAMVTEFIGRLQHESREIPYPHEGIRRVLSSSPPAPDQAAPPA